LEFLNGIQPPEIQARKESIIDVLVRDQKGTKYIIEMQVAKIKGFEKRAQFYAAKTYCTHFNAGSAYKELKRVIFLAITSYIVFPEKGQYKSDHIILDTKTYENDLKDFSFTFVELPKFQMQLNELKTLEEKWYYFLKHAEETNHIDQSLASNPEIKEAYDVLERGHWSEKELLEYERIAMTVADAKGALTAAKEDGLLEGRKEGLHEGRKEGLQEGRKEGLQEGRKEGLQEGLKEGAQKAIEKLALNLLSGRYSMEEVSEITGMSLQKIAALKDHTSKETEMNKSV
jgi:predicted transposase/invertase (TIGR01784 family)